MNAFLAQLDPPPTLQDIWGWSGGRFVVELADWLPLLAALLLAIHVWRIFRRTSGVKGGKL